MRLRQQLLPSALPSPPQSLLPADLWLCRSELRRAELRRPDLRRTRPDVRSRPELWLRSEVRLQPLLQAAVLQAALLQRALLQTALPSQLRLQHVRLQHGPGLRLRRVSTPARQALVSALGSVCTDSLSRRQPHTPLRLPLPE